MFTRVKTKYIKILFLICVFICNSLCAFASQTSLLGVNVNQSPDGSYNLLLKADNSIKIKKIINEKNNMTLQLNSTLPSDSIEIVYDNAPELGNVIVQKKNDNSTIIYLQGENISDTYISLKDISTGKVKHFDFNSKNFDSFVSVIDKNVLNISLAGFVVFFLFMLLIRPGNKKYVNNINKKSNAQKTINSIKTADRQRKVPSINYNVKAEFTNKNNHVSQPKEFIINRYNQNGKERIRKAG